MTDPNDIRTTLDAVAAHNAGVRDDTPAANGSGPAPAVTPAPSPGGVSAPARPEPPLSDAALAAIRGRCEKTTPGPWVYDGHRSVSMSANPPPYDILIAGADWKPNAEFVAHARADVPDLLDTVTHYRDLVRALTVDGVDASMAWAQRAEEAEGRYRELVGRIEARAAEMEARSTSVCDAIAFELRALLDDTPAPQEALEPARHGDDSLEWRVVANAGRSGGRRPLWAAVKAATGFGSTRAQEMCRRVGRDPDEMVGRNDDETTGGDDDWPVARAPEPLRREDDEIEAVLQEHDEGGDRGQD